VTYKINCLTFDKQSVESASPTNHSWYQSSRVIALLSGIKISAVHHSVLSQCMRVTDRQTDRITTPKTALAYARTVINYLTFDKQSVDCALY